MRDKWSWWVALDQPLRFGLITHTSTKIDMQNWGFWIYRLFLICSLPIFLCRNIRFYVRSLSGFFKCKASNCIHKMFSDKYLDWGPIKYFILTRLSKVHFCLKQIYTDYRELKSIFDKKGRKTHCKIYDSEWVHFLKSNFHPLSKDVSNQLIILNLEKNRDFLKAIS